MIGACPIFIEGRPAVWSLARYTGVEYRGVVATTPF